MDPIEVKIKLSSKQIEILRVLDDDKHTEIFFGGSAGGCFHKDTLVETLGGQKRIQEINKGDLVLSLNKKKELEYKKVLETFINGGSLEWLRVKFKDGTEIKATENHKFLFNGKWIEIGELVRGILETDRQRWDILDKQQRTIKNNELEEFWERNDNESSNKQKRLFTHNYSFKRKKEKSDNSSISSREFYSKSREQRTSKSQKLQYKGQQDRKSGMGNSEREFSSLNRTPKKFYGECGEDIKSKAKEGLRQRNELIKGISSDRNKGEIQTKKIYPKNDCSGIQSQRSNNKRYNSQKKLEACEIDLKEIYEIEFFKDNQKFYDLGIEDTKNYVITNKRIIVHNSKSFTGSYWQIKRRLKYPGSRGFLARARLKSLKESTLLTFFEVAKIMGLKLNGKRQIDFTYNAITGVIKFNNGSEEYLRDLFYYPSDPEFVGLGSTEYTDGFIDEMAEINEQAYQIIRSRMRFKLDEFGLIPKIAMGSNPCKTFIYKEFYKKWDEKKLEPWKAYVPTSVYDNPFISQHYIENLKKLDPINRARLLEGNWHYEDDPTKLFDYDAIVDLFTNEAKRGEKYCVVDVAGRGRDKTFLTNWDGLFCTKVIEMDNISSEELDQHLKKYQIPRSHCLVDEDGVGFGLVKDTAGVKGFVNNSRPIQKKKESEKEQVLHNYANLKAQCWFELSHYINSGMIGIYKEISVMHKKLLIEDLEQIKEKDPGRDRPLRILTKEEIKEVLGRSTDLGDCLEGETKILTTKGEKRIKDIQIGEKVITPYGNNKVLQTKEKSTNILYKVKFGNGKELLCTPNHKIYLNGSFKKVKSIAMREYKGEQFNLKELIKWRKKKLFTKGKNISFYPVEDIITKKEMEKSKHYTEEFMKIKQEDQSLRDTKFTTLMETISTIPLIILQSLRKRYIKDYMPLRILKKLRRYVYFVGKNLLTRVYIKKENIVPINVTRTTNIERKNILKEEIVYSAEKSLKLKNQMPQNVVQEVVRLTFGEKIKVYDLKVQKNHCYYANGFLVSNCVMMRMFFELKKPTGMGFLTFGKNIKTEDDKKQEEKEKLNRKEKIKKLVQEGKVGFGPSSRK